MEPRLGYDFSGVRVHDDPSAAHSAHAIGANAYTVGRRQAGGVERMGWARSERARQSAGGGPERTDAPARRRDTRSRRSSMTFCVHQASRWTGRRAAQWSSASAAISAAFACMTTPMRRAPRRPCKPTPTRPAAISFLARNGIPRTTRPAHAFSRTSSRTSSRMMRVPARFRMKSARHGFARGTRRRPGRGCGNAGKRAPSAAGGGSKLHRQATTDPNAAAREQIITLGESDDPANRQQALDLIVSTYYTRPPNFDGIFYDPNLRSTSPQDAETGPSRGEASFGGRQRTTIGPRFFHDIRRRFVQRVRTIGHELQHTGQRSPPGGRSFLSTLGGIGIGAGIGAGAWRHRARHRRSRGRIAVGRAHRRRAWRRRGARRHDRRHCRSVRRTAKSRCVTCTRASSSPSIGP